MFDLVRRYVDAVSGVAEVPRERAERLVADLQRRGELRTKDISSAVQDLVARNRRSRQDLVRLVQKEIRRQVSAMGLVTRDDLDKLTKRVRTLENKVKPAKASAPRKRAVVPKAPS